jgi:hypothetical protein
MKGYSDPSILKNTKDNNLTNYNSKNNANIGLNNNIYPNSNTNRISDNTY